MDDAELALSDPEDEDLEEAAPVVDGTGASVPAFTGQMQPTDATSTNFVGGEDQVRLQLELALKKSLADFEDEKKARIRAEALLAEAAKNHEEAIATRDRAEAMRTEAFSRMKVAASDAIKQRDEALKQKMETSSSHETLKGELTSISALLSVAEVDRLAARAGVKVTGQRSDASTAKGAAEAFKKRVEALVEDLVRQRQNLQSTVETMRSQIDQRNMTIAIEVSEMEAEIMRLRESLSDANKASAGKDSRISTAEHKADELARSILDAEVALGLERRRAEDAEANVRSAEFESRKHQAMMEQQRQAMLEAHAAYKDMQVQLAEAVKACGRAEAEARAEKETRERVEKERDSAREECRSVMRDMEGIVDQWRDARLAWRMEKEELARLANDAVAAREEMATEMAAERSHGGGQGEEVTTSLRREVAAKAAEVLRLEASLREARNDSGADDVAALLERATREAAEARTEQEQAEGRQKEVEKRREELERQLSEAKKASKAAWAEGRNAASMVEKLQEEAAALQASLTEARHELDSWRKTADDSGADVARERAARVAAEERAQSAAEEAEALKSRLGQLEDDVRRLREVEDDLASARSAAVDEVERCNKQISALMGQIAQWKKLAEEASLKVQSKEDMATAAINARDAAERSLQIADRRAAELRQRVESLARQLEGMEGRTEAARSASASLALSGAGETGCMASYWPLLFGRGGHSELLGRDGTWLGPGSGGGWGLSSRGRGPRVATAEMEQLMEPFV